MQKILIAAIDQAGGIGKDGYMPWHYPADLKLFMNLTMGNTIVMGRKTFEGMFDRQKAPLKGRQNIVVTSAAAEYQAKFADQYPTSELAFTTDLHCGDVELARDTKVFYCGGANLYQQVLNTIDLDIIYLSRLEESYDCDVFFPRAAESINTEFEPHIPQQLEQSFSDKMAGQKPFTFQIYTPKKLIIY
jgi:dihydrofolate reductase